MLYNELLVADVDAIANVEWMLDEEKDTRTKDLLCGGAEDKGQGEQSSACGGKGRDEGSIEEGN